MNAAANAIPSVLVVDDHDIVRLGVRHLLGARADTHDAVGLADARRKLSERSFDLMILDLGLTDGFALAELPLIREQHPKLRIIVLTSMDESVYAERALRAGADGYVMKTELQPTLLNAVNTVLAGAVYVSPAMNVSLLRRVTSPSAPAGGERLSTREIEVLRLVAAGKTTRDIADELNRSVKTIETHKQSLKQKLGADSPAMLVRVAVSWFGDAA